MSDAMSISVTAGVHSASTVRLLKRRSANEDKSSLILLETLKFMMLLPGTVQIPDCFLFYDVSCLKCKKDTFFLFFFVKHFVMQ